MVRPTDGDSKGGTGRDLTLGGLLTGQAGASKDQNPFPGGALGKRRDRRYVRELAKKARAGQKIKLSEVRRLNSILDSSKGQGTLNKRDRRAVGNLLGNHLIDETVYRKRPFDKSVENLKKYTPKGHPSRSASTNPFTQLVQDGAKPHEKDRFDTHYEGKTDPQGKNKGRPGPKGRPGKGGRGRGGGPRTAVEEMIYYGLGEFPGVDRKQAELIVGQDINRQVAEMLQMGNQMKKGQEYDINKLNALYNRTEGDLDYIFKNVQDVNKHNTGIIDQRFNTTRGTLGDLYSGLQGQMQGNTDTNRAAAMQEMARLGIQQTGMGDYDQDAAWASNMAASNQANTLANLQAQQNSAAQVGALLQSMSAGSLASAVGRAKNDRNDDISDSRQEYRGNMNEILTNINQLRGQRGSMVNELYNTMEQNAYQRWAETQQADFNNQLAASQFNAGVAKMNSDNLLSRAELRQEAARQAALKRNQNRLYQQMQATGKAYDTDLAQLFGQS